MHDLDGFMCTRDLVPCSVCGAPALAARLLENGSTIVLCVTHVSGRDQTLAILPNQPVGNLDARFRIYSSTSRLSSTTRS
jgi:hypothetical protein